MCMIVFRGGKKCRIDGVKQNNEIDKEVGISTCVEPMKVMLFDD